ncbi:MAG TPA: hypothetical protein VKB86_00380 [Pyrinomonadaceae bacterium]|nr:hypothetical protein [Pyrinomonadaceae bacterium]
MPAAQKVAGIRVYVGKSFGSATRPLEQSTCMVEFQKGSKQQDTATKSER